MKTNNVAILTVLSLGLSSFLSREIDLSKPWTTEVAKYAWRTLKASKLSQKAFAEAHGFSVSRFRSKAALAALAVK